MWNSAFLRTDLVSYINLDSSLSIVIASAETLKGNRKKLCTGKMKICWQRTNLIKLCEKCTDFFSTESN